jgi:hypothetical protein
LTASSSSGADNKSEVALKLFLSAAPFNSSSILQQFECKRKRERESESEREREREMKPFTFVRKKERERKEERARA